MFLSITLFVLIGVFNNAWAINKRLDGLDAIPKPAIYFQYGLDQNHRSLNDQHEAHCGYYALYFALCFNKSTNYKTSLKLIRKRNQTEEDTWCLNTMLGHWESFMSISRNLACTEISPQSVSWLSKKELLALIRHNLQNDFFKTFKNASKRQFRKAVSLASSINHGDNIQKSTNRELLLQVQYLRSSPWFNITLIDQLDDNESITTRQTELARIKQQATTLNKHGIAQAVIIGLEKHWECIGFRKEKSGISMTIHNSSKIPGTMNHWYKELYSWFCHPNTIEI